MISEIEEKTRRAKKKRANKWFRSKQHGSSTRELCLVTLGFPVPDTDHQKHALRLDETLSVARLYIAMWMQTAVSKAVCGIEKISRKEIN